MFYKCNTNGLSGESRNYYNFKINKKKTYLHHCSYPTMCDRQRNIKNYSNVAYSKYLYNQHYHRPTN